MIAFKEEKFLSSLQAYCINRKDDRKVKTDHSTVSTTVVCKKILFLRELDTVNSR